MALYGRSGAGPSQRSQSRPGSAASSGRSQGTGGPATAASTLLTLPSTPSRTSSHAARNSPMDRCMEPTCKIRLCARAAFTIARPSSTVCAIGFSQ